MRVAAFAVVCAQHFGSYGFPEPSRASHANESAIGVDALVQKGKNPCFIDITVSNALSKYGVAKIQILAHRFHLLQQTADGERPILFTENGPRI